jgi:hypothetical protein
MVRRDSDPTRRRLSLAVWNKLNNAITAVVTPTFALGMMAVKETKEALTNPVKLLSARAFPPTGAFGPSVVSGRRETATNKSPISAPEAPAAAMKWVRYATGTILAPL